MLTYQTIYDVAKAQQRVKRGTYRWESDSYSLDTDQLFLFTYKDRGLLDSKNNLDQIIDLARSHKQNLVLIKSHTVQVAGSAPTHAQVMAELFPTSWLEEHRTWLDYSTTPKPEIDLTTRGGVMGFYSYRACLCLDEHQGVYDVATGNRLTNRRDTIQRIWDLGFAAQRGRPLSIAKPRWTGTREDLEEITALADRHWDRRRNSEVSKKLTSAYTSINRYAAWPGAW